MHGAYRARFEYLSSTGLYAGPHKDRIRGEFADLVNEILDEVKVVVGGEALPVPLRNCFVKVVWTKLPRS